MIWPFTRKPLVVLHVRHTKVPTICPKAKARAMALAMGRNDLAERLK